MKFLFLSDYQEGAHPSIIGALYNTNSIQTPGYGEDLFCEEARALIREACDAPQADVHFLVGGTQTNATVISSILKPYQGALCASTAHIGVHETGAIEHGGHKVLPLASVDGKITSALVEEALRSHYSDPSFEHIVQPGMVYLSFPTELGTIYTKSELADIKEVCLKYEIPLYIDGARLGYGLTCDRSDCTLQDIASLADIFYIGGTKQGALFGEAVVIMNDTLKKDFRYNIKQNGGMLAKGRLLGIQFRELFTDSLYFRLSVKANRCAEKIREALAERGFEMLVDSPTNQLFPIMTRQQAEKLSYDAGFEYWQNMPDGRVAIRICTSWATTSCAVDSIVSAISALGE